MHIKACYRIGKHNTDVAVIRPLKVMFESHDQALCFIKKFGECKKMVNTYPEIKNLKITHDRTPAQQNHFQHLRAELNNKIETPTHRWIIRYFGDIPQIVKQRKHPPNQQLQSQQ